MLLVRHARAAGQEPEAPLTPEGQEQARELADTLAQAGVTRIISSPWRRAVDTALKASFAFPALKFPGGESSSAAKARIQAVVQEITNSDGTTVIVTHGNLLALGLGLNYGGWAALKNPDVWLYASPPYRWDG